MEEVFYTVQEIADIIRVHPKTVQGYIRSGEIKAFKVGKDWRVPKKSFQQWVKNRIEKNEIEVSCTRDAHD